MLMILMGQLFIAALIEESEYMMKGLVVNIGLWEERKVLTNRAVGGLGKTPESFYVLRINDYLGS